MKPILRLILLVLFAINTIPLFALRKRPKKYYATQKKNTSVQPKDENDYEARDFAWAFCTRRKPKFIKRTVKTPYGRTKEIFLIDIGHNQTIPAGEDFDPQQLADSDPRMTIDFDIKTRRVYTCQEIKDNIAFREVQVECKKRGFDHGVFTNGTEGCFREW